MGRPPADPSSYQTDQHQEFVTQPPQEYQPDPTYQENYSAHVQEPSYYQEQQQQQQQYPQGFGPQQPVQQLAQFPPQSPIPNPNQPTAAYPPPAYPPPPPPPPTHQPVQFPPPQLQNPTKLQPAGPYSYPPQGNPANQPVQFPPPNPRQANPMYPNQNPAAYPPPQDFPVKSTQNAAYYNNHSTQSQPVQFPLQNPVTGYNVPSTPQKPLPQPINDTAAPGIPMSQQPAQVFNQRWHSGIFHCMDDPENALVTAFFPCVTFGQIAEIIDNGQTTCSTNGLVYGLIALIIYAPCIVSCSYRTKLRAKYGLIEDPAPDWVTHLLFEWCALCQEYRELKHRGFDPAIGWHANVQGRSMQQQPQVAMTPPMNQRMRQ